MRLIASYWHNRFDKLLHSDFWMVETSVWLHKLARALVAVFIPILLLQKDYAVNEVLLWFLIYTLLDVPFNFLARWLTRRIGAIAVTILGKISLLGFFIVFSFLGAASWPILILLALLNAIYDAFYWVAHLYIFLESDKRSEKTRRGVNILRAVKAVAALIAPAAGAAILVFGTETMLLYSATAIMALSIIPLFFTHHIQDTPAYPQQHWRAFFKHPREWRNYSITMLYAVHDNTETVVLPIVIFLLFSNVQSVAAIPVAVAATAIAFALFSHRLPKTRYQHLITIGALSLAVIWIARLFIESQEAFYATFVLVGVFNLFIANPLDTDLFDRAKATDPLSGMTYRNALYMFAVFIFYGILLLLVEVLSVSFMVAAASMVTIVVVNTIVFRYLQKR